MPTRNISNNLCESCIRSLGSSVVLTFDVADTGVCGRCGRKAEVFDLELVSFYFSVGLSSDVILQKLPRLRCPHNDLADTASLSWPQIGERLSKVVTPRV